MKIAIDIMGSDLGEQELAQAITAFAADNSDCHLVVCGKKQLLNFAAANIEVIDAPGIVDMSDGALELVRKRDSSLVKAVDLLAKKEVDAVVSCGSTGALLAASTIKCRLLEGVQRAGIISFFPTVLENKQVAVLDLGANNENTAEQLYDFALIGSAFVSAIAANNNPKIYLLSNGVEEGKGSPVGKEAFLLLKKLPNFHGNIEARDVMLGEADVVVCGGFEGNIFLKASEGCAKIMLKKLKKAFLANWRSKLGYLLVRKSLKKELASMDYRRTGGGMIAGVNGIVVKAHGNSNKKSFYNALEICKALIKAKVLEKMKNEQVTGISKDN